MSAQHHERGGEFLHRTLPQLNGLGVLNRGLLATREPDLAIELEGEGLFARMLQHEMDHLDGLVFIDRLSPLKRSLYLRKLKKQVRAERSP